MGKRTGWLAVVAVVFGMAGVSQAAEPTPEPEGVGSCWEIKPMCFAGQHAICLCDIVQNCFWVCK